jgi:hypothetical protein
LRAFACFADQQIDADQRLDALLQRLTVELDHREQVARIGQRDRRHAARGHRLHQLRHAHDAVAQRELGMQAQVDEGGHGQSE